MYENITAIYFECYLKFEIEPNEFIHKIYHPILLSLFDKQLWEIKIYEDWHENVKTAQVWHSGRMVIIDVHILREIQF